MSVPVPSEWAQMLLIWTLMHEWPPPRVDLKLRCAQMAGAIGPVHVGAALRNRRWSGPQLPPKKKPVITVESSKASGAT